MTTREKIEYWCIPPEADAEFAAEMEAVLETYARPYDASHPVLCMDEQPVQLLAETRTPIAATARHPARVDYEYARAGTASAFAFCEPLAGWRGVTVRERRTKRDWAEEVARVLDERYGACARVTLVCDNLNTHTRGAFYEAFCPERARAYVRKIDFCYTPKPRQLAERRRVRAERDDAAVRGGAADRHPRALARRSRGVELGRERATTRGRLANECR